MARRRRNPPDLFHHTTAEKAARIYREQRLCSAGEPDVYVTTADYDIGYGPVAVPIYVPAKILKLDDEFPDGRQDFRIGVKGGSVAVYAGKPFAVKQQRETRKDEGPSFRIRRKNPRAGSPRHRNAGTFHRPGPAGGGGRNDRDFERDYRRQVRELAGDPSLSSSSMQRHLKAAGRRPGSVTDKIVGPTTRKEWIEFAGYAPNMVEKVDGVALSGDYPGVRIDIIEGVGTKTGRGVKISSRHKPVWLVWFNSGERFALTGGPSAMRELARDMQRLGEPVLLTKVDYVAPRYPVPVGVKRTRANRDMSIAYTHEVENPTVLTWNGKLDPRHARFDIRVKGKRRRWVNRSGLTF